jgi:hypothetical protein
MCYLVTPMALAPNAHASLTKASSRLDAAWIEIERALVAASLSEITPGDACDRMCDAMAKHVGVRCVLIDGHHSGNDPDHYGGGDTRLLIGNTIDDNAATLVISSPSSVLDHVLDRASLERLKRLFVLLLAVVHPIPRAVETIHTLRNRLAGVQANLELMEMMIPHPSELASQAQREEVTTALHHALRACREMATTLRDLST